MIMVLNQSLLQTDAQSMHVIYISLTTRLLHMQFPYKGDLDKWCRL